MNINFKRLKNIYIRLFILSPKFISSIIFIPFLYLIGWLLANPILLFGVNKESISLIGTIFTFLIFVLSLPKWFEIRWGLKNTWKLLGVKKIDRNRGLVFYFLRGFLLSIILISLILIPIIGTQWGFWIGKLSSEMAINAIFLIIGIGFTEELIFRGWLLEEFKNQFGLKKAIILQALIFSLVHIGLDLPLLEMVSILTGLFFLGILLSLTRLKDNYSLWGCIGLHGGLVGLWFISNNGLLLISKDAPIWLVGPGTINTNPLGGLFGIILMIVFCCFYLLSLKK
tara:strand:- start:876 stop:1727 length:852 start_codon:yes stop_codon:yes gene_type:complete